MTKSMLGKTAKKKPFISKAMHNTILINLHFADEISEKTKKNISYVMCKPQTNRTNQTKQYVSQFNLFQFPGCHS